MKIILLVILALTVVAIIVFISVCHCMDNTTGYDEMWEFDNCYYKGNCLMDCAYRSECPFYSYS